MHEVARRRGTESSSERAHSLLGDDLLERPEHAAGVLHGVQLDAGLNDVDWAERRMRNRAADATSERCLGVVCQVIRDRPVRRVGEWCCTQRWESRWAGRESAAATDC